MRRSIEGSLARLGISRLPFVYIHDPEHTTFEQVMQRGGALDALQRLRAEGVIGDLGISGGPIDMLIRYVESGAFAAVETHNRYTLLNRSAAPLLDVATARDVAVVNAAPYGSGMLAKGPAAFARYAYQAAHARARGAGAPAGRVVPGARGAVGRGGPAVLTARTAHHVHRRGHDAAGARGPDAGSGASPHS